MPSSDNKIQLVKLFNKKIAQKHNILRLENQLYCNLKSILTV